MYRDQLEHIIRAAGSILLEDSIIIVGSQSILACPEQYIPTEAMESVEADIIPFNDPDGHKADLITGAIGEDSHFHKTFGIYGHGVEDVTIRIPKGWQDRLLPLHSQNTRGVTAFCLEPHDLVIAKSIAGRDKDLLFCSALVKARLVDESILLRRLNETDCSPQERARVKGYITRYFAERNA